MGFKAKFRIMRSRISLILLWLLSLVIFFMLTGCQLFQQQPTTELYGKARHTGSVTMLRVDDSWHPEPSKRSVYKVGGEARKQNPPYLPVRHKGDISYLDGPDRIVTQEDFVTVTLKTAFIKYFKELGGTRRKGEIALVLSFEAGNLARNSVLIYASEGQTLGSLLDLDDMPIIGPVKFQGDDIMVRIVMIELDQIENQAQKQFIRALANVGSTLAPEIGPALAIAQPIADFIISQNADDVIIDHRLSLQRVTKGQLATRNVLLYGTYALLFQEDRLINSDAPEVAPLALLPPAPDRIRYSPHSGRLYRVYNYYPVLKTEDEPDGEDSQCQKFEVLAPTFCGELYEGQGPIYYDAFYESDGSCEDPNLYNWKYRKCVLEDWVNRKKAAAFRQMQLGYIKPHIGDLETLFSLSKALEAAGTEGQRGKRFQINLKPQDNGQKNDDRESDRFYFDYPVIQYPEANTLLAQYPLHTYLLFSVDRSLGGEGRTADSRFQSFTEFIDQELGAVRDFDQLGELADSLNQAVVKRKQMQIIYKKVAAMRKDQEAAKICLLWKQLSNPTGSESIKYDTLLDREIYNEMYHITDELWTDSSEAIQYLQENQCRIKADQPENISCSCD